MPTSLRTHLLGNLVSEVTRLRSLGFGLCDIMQGQKMPRYKKWNHFSREPDHFEHCVKNVPGLPNVGILAGSLSGNLVIVDLDNADIRSAAAKCLPRTMTDGRPSTGPAHYYYRTTDIPAWATAASDVAGGLGGPKTFHFHDDKGKSIGLDFQGTGSQVVCPPSLHHSGERRKWIVDPEHILTLPFLDLWAIIKKLAKDFGATNTDRECQHPPERRTGQVGVTRGHIDPHVMQRAINYLAKCRPAISGQGGHDATMWAARCMVYGFDLGVGLGLELLMEYYNRRCSPEWSVAELIHKCEQADTVPFDKPRGGLLNFTWGRGAAAPGSTSPTANTGSTSSVPSAKSERLAKGKAPIAKSEEPIANSVRTPVTKKERAAAWLKEFLSTGPYRWPSEEVIEAGAKQGYGRKLLFTAKHSAGVGVVKEQGSMTGGWYWGIGNTEAVRQLPIRPQPDPAAAAGAKGAPFMAAHDSPPPSPAPINARPRRVHPHQCPPTVLAKGMYCSVGTPRIPTSVCAEITYVIPLGQYPNLGQSPQPGQYRQYLNLGQSINLGQYPNLGQYLGLDEWHVAPRIAPHPRRVHIAELAEE